MSRGWTSQELTVVEDDDTLWNVAEAAVQLGALPCDPEDTPLTITVAKLRDLVRYHRLPPAGKRRSSRPGHPGRYARVYHAADFIALYERLDFESAA
jgi:hypothetical protein